MTLSSWILGNCRFASVTLPGATSPGEWDIDGMALDVIMDMHSWANSAGHNPDAVMASSLGLNIAMLRDELRQKLSEAEASHIAEEVKDKIKELFDPDGQFGGDWQQVIAYLRKRVEFYPSQKGTRQKEPSVPEVENPEEMGIRARLFEIWSMSEQDQAALKPEADQLEQRLRELGAGTRTASWLRGNCRFATDFNYDRTLRDLWVEVLSGGMEVFGVNFSTENNDSIAEPFKLTFDAGNDMKDEVVCQPCAAAGDWEASILYYRCQVTHGALLSFGTEVASWHEPYFVFIPTPQEGNVNLMPGKKCKYVAKQADDREDYDERKARVALKKFVKKAFAEYEKNMKAKNETRGNDGE